MLSRQGSTPNTILVVILHGSAIQSKWRETYYYTNHTELYFLLNEVGTNQHAEKSSWNEEHGQRVLQSIDVDIYQDILDDESNEKVEVQLN